MYRKLLFELSKEGRRGHYLPQCDVPEIEKYSEPVSIPINSSPVLEIESAKEENYHDQEQETRIP